MYRAAERMEMNHTNSSGPAASPRADQLCMLNPLTTNSKWVASCSAMSTTKQVAVIIGKETVCVVADDGPPLNKFSNPSLETWDSQS